jgi:hypothetical protein
VFKKAFLYFIPLVLLLPQLLSAQYDAPLYTSYTTSAARAKLYERLVKNTITKNLSLPLTDSTEENWQEAFNAMEVLDFTSPFTLAKVHAAFDNIVTKSAFFQKALLEVIYTLYPKKFSSQVTELLHNSFDPKVFAMCSEYLIQHASDSALKNKITMKLFEKFGDSVYAYPILSRLQTRLEPPKLSKVYSTRELLNGILNKSFLPNQIVMYSFQRKNRDYPGMVIL